VASRQQDLENTWGIQVSSIWVDPGLWTSPQPTRLPCRGSLQTTGASGCPPAVCAVRGCGLSWGHQCLTQQLGYRSGPGACREAKGTEVKGAFPSPAFVYHPTQQSAPVHALRLTHKCHCASCTAEETEAQKGRDLVTSAFTCHVSQMGPCDSERS
jgi:hypothetical protein